MPYRFWPRLPDGSESPGPNPKQKLIWIEKMPIESRPHLCDVDGVLSLGGTRSGKTVGIAARCASQMVKYPGTRIIVGSTDYAHLEATVILDYQELFSQNEPWDHPSVKVFPNRQHKHLLISNGKGKRDSIIHFVNLEKKDGQTVLGQACDIFHIDEPQLLKRGVEIQNALITRLSNSATPLKQYFLSGNPTQNLAWIKTDWKLKQFEEGYKGKPIPIGMPCTHQFCFHCGLAKNGRRQILYIDGVCPSCGYIKKGNCPGDQYSRRIIFSSSEDNAEFLPESYQGIVDTHLTGDAKLKFGAGKIIKDTGGLCYPRFGEYNQADENRPINLNEDLTFFLDLNQRPQASGTYQKRKVSGITFIDVIDEFALWDKDIIDVGNEFVKRYGNLGFKKIVYVYGDPAMRTGHIVRYKDMITKDKFEVLARILREGGFRVRLMTPSTKYSIKDRIECMNYNLKDKESIARISFNPACEWMIASAEGTKWAPGEKEEDKTVDKECMKKGKPGDVWGTTHHMAALGYALLKDSPMIKIVEKTPFFVGASGTATILNSDGVLEQRDYSKPEDFETEEDEDELYLEEPEPSPIIKPPSLISLADSWRRAGLTNLRRLF